MRITVSRRIAEAMLTGGATVLLYPLSWWLRRGLGLDLAEYGTSFFFFYLAFIINDPHFAVTYLLFYRGARKRAFSTDFPLAQRLRWLFSGVVAPVVLGVWAFAAVKMHSAQTLGWMVQLMYLLVGWHYVKQGFGVLSVLSARRGVRVTQTERRVVLFHAFTGWAFAWANPAAPAGEFEERGVVYTALAHPRWLETITFGLFATSTLALLFVLVDRKRKTGQFLPLAPLTGLLMSIWSWTIFSGIDPLVRYAIPALHSVQYLYFVWLLRGNEARAQEGPPAFGRPVAVRLVFLALGALGLGWLFFHGAPEFLDTAFTRKTPQWEVPDAMGETPYLAAIYTVVNLHHYFMDHVIWRRENPETKYMQDTQVAGAAEPEPEAARLAA